MMRPSLKGFVESGVDRVMMLIAAPDLKVFRYVILNSFPRSIRRRCGFIDRSLTLLKPDFKGTIVTVEGLKFSLVDEEALHIVLPSFERWIEKMKVKTGDVFVDIGAHIGKYSMKFSKVAKTVVAIEPDPENFESLKRNIELNGLKNVIAVRKAAWNRKGTMKFYKGDVKGHGTIKRDCGYGWCEVQTERVDEILNSLGINKVDWIKIDVEGAEYEVLEGLTETITKDKPKIIVEVWAENEEKVHLFMKKHGYTPYQLEKGDSLSYYLFVPRSNPAW